MNVATALLLDFPLPSEVEIAVTTPPPTSTTSTTISGATPVSTATQPASKPTPTPAKKMSKLAAFQTTNPADFRLTEIPKLHDFVTSKGMMAGVAAYDAAMSQWLQSTQRAISDQLSKINAKIPPSGS